VVLTEETDWIGSQLTSQAVPPDEHRWIESFGCTARYRRFRQGVRRYDRDVDRSVERPDFYDKWHHYVPALSPAWPGKMLSWTYSYPKTCEPITATFDPANGEGSFWRCRRLISREHWAPGHEPHEVTLCNWPQNDYLEDNIIDKDEVAIFADSVGVGCYRLDLHPSAGRDNYIDTNSPPFQIPLGTLVPVRVENVLPTATISVPRISAMAVIGSTRSSEISARRPDCWRLFIYNKK